MPLYEQLVENLVHYVFFLQSLATRRSQNSVQIYEKLVFHFGFFQPATLFFFSSFSKGSQTGSTNLVDILVTRGSGNLPTKYLVKIVKI